MQALGTGSAPPSSSPFPSSSPANVGTVSPDCVHCCKGPKKRGHPSPWGCFPSPPCGSHQGCVAGAGLCSALFAASRACSLSVLAPQVPIVGEACLLGKQGYNSEQGKPANSIGTPCSILEGSSSLDALSTHLFHRQEAYVRLCCSDSSCGPPLHSEKTQSPENDEDDTSASTPDGVTRTRFCLKELRNREKQTNPLVSGIRQQTAEDSD